VDIGKWGAGTWIAAAGAVIALIAAVAAWSQARLAKRSAGAADVQAAAAQVQAEAARVQAEAAQEQVILTRQQLATAKSNSHEAAAPGFIFPASTIRGTEKGEKPVAHITVKQVGGGKLSQVTATVTCDNDVLGFIADDSGIANTTTWTNSAADSTHELKVGLAKAEPVDVVLDFASVGTDPGKTWESSRTTRPVLPSRPIAFGKAPKVTKPLQGHAVADRPASERRRGGKVPDSARYRLRPSRCGRTPEDWRGASRTSVGRLAVGGMPDWMRKALRAPGVFAWRWFTGSPSTGCPAPTPAGSPRGHAELDTNAAPRPPEALGAEARADLRGLRAEWWELRVRRRLGREWRETERRVLAEHQHGDGTSLQDWDADDQDADLHCPQPRAAGRPCLHPLRPVRHYRRRDGGHADADLLDDRHPPRTAC
jgi:hypothetical protein